MSSPAPSALSAAAPSFVTLPHLSRGATDVYKLRLGALVECNRRMLQIGIRAPKEKVPLSIFQAALGLDKGLEEYLLHTGEFHAIVVEFILKQTTLWPVIIADVIRITPAEAEQVDAMDAFDIVLAAANLIDWAGLKEKGRAFFSAIGVLSDALTPEPANAPAPAAASPPGSTGNSASPESSPPNSPA